jgi:hypothetical protein
VNSLICAFAGFLVEACRRPAPLGLPPIRAYQCAYAGSVIDWMTRRTRRDGSVWALG